MLLRQLKYFVDVIEYESFTEAAEQNYISQSAISQQIKALEQEMGVSLLKREGRHFSLTVAGRYLYEHAKPLLAEVETLKQETIRRGLDDDMELRIGFPKNFNTEALSKTMASFSALYPDVRLSIISGTHEELFQALIHDLIDMKISEQRRVYDRDYENIPLCQSECYIELASGHPLASLDEVDISSLQDLNCIIVVSKGFEEGEKAFYEETLRLSHRFVYAYSLDEARLMVMGKRGYLPVDQLGSLPEPQNGLSRILLKRDGQTLSRNYFACYKKNKPAYYIEEWIRLFEMHLNKPNESIA